MQTALRSLNDEKNSCGLKMTNQSIFKAKLFTVHVSAKTEGHCSDLHAQQGKLQVLMRYQATVIKGCVKISLKYKPKQRMVLLFVSFFYHLWV